MEGLRKTLSLISLCIGQTEPLFEHYIKLKSKYIVCLKISWCYKNGIT